MTAFRHLSLEGGGLMLAAFLTLASGEYELLIPSEPGTIVCTKSAKMCEEARAAIAAAPQRWALVPRETPTQCVPSTRCFSPRSNCIVGYNCGD